MHASWRLQTTIPGDEARRLTQLSDLVDELLRLVSACPSDPPDEHTLLAEEPFGFRLHLPTGALRSLFVSQRSSADGTALLTWTTREGDAGSAFVPPTEMWAVWPLLTHLVARLHGDEMELAYAAAAERPILARSTWIHPNGWWDSWKNRPLEHTEEPRTIGEAYREVVYPVVLQSLSAALPGRVLDVCGGDGELGEAALQLGATEVVVLDRNAVAVASARTRLDGQSARVELADATEPWSLGTFDAVLLVGAISANVVSHADAERIVSNVAACLRPGGVAIVAGWNPCVLEADDFRAAGLVVRNLSLPPIQVGMLPRQHYVLQAPSGS